MVRVRTKVSAFCFRLCKARVRIRSPPLRSNPAYDFMEASQRGSLCDDDGANMSFRGEMPRAGDGDGQNSDTQNGNRIMILIDSSQEAKGALQWALSHAVQKEDTVILLHIAKPSKRGLESDETDHENPRAYGLLYAMKSMCHSKRPGVKVEEVVVLKEKDKGRLIVEEAKQRRTSLLVLGHRRRPFAWRLVMRWSGTNSSSAVADYCIQNAECMTIAVRRKGRKLGGYLITTKRHNKFWLLA
ncbi:hypothetical protein Dimus_011415 [Dionaea muscipula]